MLKLIILIIIGNIFFYSCISTDKKVKKSVLILESNTRQYHIISIDSLEDKMVKDSNFVNYFLSIMKLLPKSFMNKFISGNDSTRDSLFYDLDSINSEIENKIQNHDSINSHQKSNFIEFMLGINLTEYKLLLDSMRIYKMKIQKSFPELKLLTENQKQDLYSNLMKKIKDNPEMIKESEILRNFNKSIFDYIMNKKY